MAKNYEISNAAIEDWEEQMDLMRRLEKRLK